MYYVDQDLVIYTNRLRKFHGNIFA